MWGILITSQCYSQIILFGVLYTKFTAKNTYIAAFVHIIIHKYCLLCPSVNQRIASQELTTRIDHMKNIGRHGIATCHAIIISLHPVTHV